MVGYEVNEVLTCRNPTGFQKYGLNSQVTDPIQIAAAQELVREYFSWFFALIPGSESDPTFRGWEDELEAIPGVCVPPKESYLLATVDGQLSGCVTLKRLDEENCELKRLYVRPIFRGQSVGTHLVAAFMQSARELGYKFAVLDSSYPWQKRMIFIGNPDSKLLMRHLIFQTS